MPDQTSRRFAPAGFLPSAEERELEKQWEPLLADERKAREIAFEELTSQARELGADAVVGIDIDYEVLGEKNGMLMVTVSGTAVQLA